MRRRDFPATPSIAVGLLPLAARGAGDSRIAVLAAGVDRGRLEPLFSELRALRYDERSIEVHYEAQVLDQNRLIAREIVTHAPNVIIAYSNVDVVAAKEATSQIPIVMVLSSTPIEAGLIRSLDHPGGNVTGTTVQASAMGAKLIELLKQVVPRASTVGLLWDPTFPGMEVYYREALRGAAALGVRYRESRVTTEREFDEAIVALRQSRPDALYVAMTGQLYSQYKRILKVADELRLPAIYTEEFVVPDGGLIAYSADHSALMRRSAGYVDRILQGAKPADLPVEELNTFRLGINLKTAKGLGLSVPHSMLLRATSVVDK